MPCKYTKNHKETNAVLDQLFLTSNTVLNISTISVQEQQAEVVILREIL